MGLDSIAIAVISGFFILLWLEMQGSFYDSKFLLFGHINPHKKPLFGNRKWAIPEKVRTGGFEEILF